MKKSVLIGISIFGILMTTSLFAEDFRQLYHGTNSIIFALLPHTDYKSVPTGELLFKYEIAPLSGELGNGIATEGINERNVSFAVDSYAGMAVGYSERIKEKSAVESVMKFNPEEILREMSAEKYFETLTFCLLRLMQYRQLCPEKYNTFLRVESVDIKRFQDSINIDKDRLFDISREEEFLKFMECPVSEPDVRKPAYRTTKCYASTPKTFEEALEILKLQIHDDLYRRFWLQFPDDAYQSTFWAHLLGDTDEEAKDLLKCALYLLNNNMLEGKNRDSVAQDVHDIKALFQKRIEWKTERFKRIKALIQIAFKAPDLGVCEDIKKSLESELFPVVLFANTNREGVWGMGGFGIHAEFAITGAVPFGKNGISIIYVPSDKIEVIKRWLHDHSRYLDYDNIKVEDISLLPR